MKRLVAGLSMLIYLLGICYSSAYCQTNNGGLGKVVSKLKSYSSEHLVEKTYLHFDKPYYVAGDTIYFKAYVTLGEKHQPSGLSGVLHVDLINTIGKIDQSIKLQISNGLTWGDFALPDSLPKGDYRVRAYTQWMRNEGDDGYFNQTIPVGSANKDKVLESSTTRKAANIKPDLQFFPEGGELVTGVSSKVAFKAVGADGLGVKVDGVVLDNTGNEVCKFTAAHLGMGYFYLTPELGKTYKARITYANGDHDTADLPLSSPNGIMLSINNDAVDSAPLKIIANESYFTENRDKIIGLIVYSGGVATTVPIKLDSAIIHLAILKRHLYPGITKVTLFSATGEPLSERLIFIQRPDQLNLAIDPDKTGYHTHEKVHININASNRADSAVSGHFSVSVIDEGKVPVDENSEITIDNYLLLTSELKGRIEQPNYYFTNVNDETRANLDLVMLTHGYRRFEWKRLLNNGYAPIAFQPERGLEITGVAKNLSDKPIANGTVSLIPMHSGSFMKTVTDDRGRFRFSNLTFSDTDKFILQAVNAKGKNNTRLTYDKDAPEPVIIAPAFAGNNHIDQLMSAYMDNSVKQQEDIARYGGFKGRFLKNITIKDKKTTDISTHPDLVSPQFADQVVTRDALEKSGEPTLSGRLLGKLHGFAVNPFNGRSSAGLIVVDGVEQPPEFMLDDINPNDVESVAALVYAGSSGIYGVRGGHGVLVITTRQGKGLDSKDIASIGVLPISPKGFYKAREFYSPKYDIAAPANNRTDYRTTIYWKPEMATDKDGSTSFEYYNADGPGTYRLVIEGIDEKGNIGRQVYRYKVE